MPFNLVYTKSAVKDIKKFDHIVKKRIKNKIEEYAKDPVTNAKKLINTTIGSYRWRVGDYRIVFDIEDKDIVILRIGHRREIYK